MSTGPNIPLREAEAASVEFFRLVEESCERHAVAGSVRRRRPEVGDIEHVCISAVGTYTPAGGMFPVDGPLLLNRLDELVADGTIEKQVKSDGRTRWGDKYRACLYRGRVHEVFVADRDNWGAILAIRTGPAEFSQDAVTRIRDRGKLRQKDGYLRYADGSVFGCSTEEAFFSAAGMECQPPHLRGG